MFEVKYRDEQIRVSPEEAGAAILTKLKLMAQEHTGEDIVDVVITVPAYFNSSQRLATRNAATIAGLNCMDILNEPVAAALVSCCESVTLNQTLIMSSRPIFNPKTQFILS